MLEDREARQVYRSVFIGKSGQLILSELMELCDFLEPMGDHSDPRMTERQAGQRDMVNHILSQIGITGNPMGRDFERIVATLIKTRPWDIDQPGPVQEVAEDGLSG